MLSEFYERKRRLAYAIAFLSFLLLFGSYSVGFLLEVTGHPRAAADGEDVHVLLRVSSPDGNEAASRLMLLDPALRLRGRWDLPGKGRAIVAEGGDVTAYFDARYAVLRGGETIRGADLGQDWDVQAAAHDPQRGQSWIFGWSRTRGRIVARRRVLGAYSGEMEVADSPEPERVSAAVDGAAGPLVAWREKGSGIVRTVLFDGEKFAPGERFDLTGSDVWDAVLMDGRTVVLYYHRDDRSWTHVTFRLRCCDRCGRPPLPATRISWRDPILLLARKITGVGAAVSADRLYLVVTRSTTVQAAAVPLPSLQPEPGAKLAPLGAAPLWRRIVAMLAPILLLFFSFSLVFLGFTLLRERGRFVLEKIRPAAPRAGLPHAEILQRAMAHILDLIVLMPVLFVAVEILSVAPETSEIDFTDPRFRAMAAVWFALDFLYHFTMEWAWGRTIGKKVIGLRVTELDGSRLRFRGALVRNVVRLVDAEIIHGGAFLGTAVMMLTARRQRLGDVVGRTLVLQEGAPPPSGPPQGDGARR